MSQHSEGAKGRGKARRRKAAALRVANTPCGLGVFAGRDFLPGEVVGEIEGRVITDPDFGSRYCYDMGDERCIEPVAPFRFLNHSCEPNCQFRPLDVRTEAELAPRRRVFVLAHDDILAGDELTIDYGWPAHMAIPCLCKTENCRGWVVARRELGDVLAGLDALSSR